MEMVALKICLKNFLMEPFRISGLAKKECCPVSRILSLAPR
jgi:hypothetical protein